jgi:hypothetical protein
MRSGSSGKVDRPPVRLTEPIAQLLPAGTCVLCVRLAVNDVRCEGTGIGDWGEDRPVGYVEHLDGRNPTTVAPLDRRRYAYRANPLGLSTDGDDKRLGSQQGT